MSIQTLSPVTANPAAGAHKAMWYLTIYAGISGAQTALELVRGFSSNFLAIRAARHLHNGMLARLLRCVRDVVYLVHAYARLGSSSLDDFPMMWHPHQCRPSGGPLISSVLQDQLLRHRVSGKDLMPGAACLAGHQCHSSTQIRWVESSTG